MTEPVAAVDCGTNTIRLLIGALPDVTVRESRIVRLGEGVDRTGRLGEQALVRTLAAVEEYAALVAAAGVPPERLRFCATSATRDAANAEVFRAGVRDRLGVEPEVLTGAQEAALTYAGAVRDLSASEPRPVLVIDVGGGSTELVLGRDEPETACSLDVGSVRLHERHLHSDPPTAAEVAACVADIDAALDACVVDPAAARTVVGVAGTVLTLAAAVLDLPAYDAAASDRAVLPVPAVEAVVRRLLALTIAQRAALPAMVPGREDVIAAGGLIVSRVLRRCRVDVLVASRSDLLDGIAWSLVDSTP